MQNKNPKYNSVVVIVVIALWQEINMNQEPTTNKVLTRVRNFLKSIEDSIISIEDLIISILLSIFIILLAIDIYLAIYFNSSWGWS